MNYFERLISFKVENQQQVGDNICLVNGESSFLVNGQPYRLHT